MDSKIVFVALVLIASFALPTLATFEKDFITAEAVRAILRKTSTNAIMPSEEAITALTGKTVISNVVLEEALLKNIDHGVNGVPCGESCVWIPCVTSVIGCSCSSKVCYLNSLKM